MISISLFYGRFPIPLKRQAVIQRRIYIAIGIREDGTKEVLRVMRLLN